MGVLAGYCAGGEIPAGDADVGIVALHGGDGRDGAFEGHGWLRWWFQPSSLSDFAPR